MYEIIKPTGDVDEIFFSFQQKLTEAFVVHYSRIAMVLERAQDPDTLSNRVVHVSVQLFSNEELAVRMTEHLSLLQVMVVSLKNMMSRILIALPLNSKCNSRKLLVFNDTIDNNAI